MATVPDNQTGGAPKSPASSRSARKTMSKRKRTAAKATKRAAKMKTKAKRAPASCFVLMPFKEPFETYYSAILEPAVVAAGLLPERGDSLFRPSPIMGDIWEMIQKAKLVVAELTEKNANVFYELGLAHAIGKPVVMVAESIEDVPFDLQPLRVLLYDKNDPAWGKKLRASLAASIRETLDDTVSAIPPMFRKTVKSGAPPETRMASRVDALEREVAGIRQTAGRQLRRDRGVSSPGELFRRLKHTRSRVIQVDLVRRAMIGHMPLKLIEDVVMSALPPTTAKQIMRDAYQLRSSVEHDA